MMPEKTKTKVTYKEKIIKPVISQRRLTALQSGRYTPTPREKRLINSFKRRLTYNTLRAYGVSSKQADRLKSAGVAGIESVIDQYLKGARFLANVRGTTVQAILASLKKADISPESFKKRIISSGLRDLKGAMQESEFENLVDSYMEDDFDEIL